VNLELHSDRLVLTPLAPTDLDISIEMFTDPEVVRYAGRPMTRTSIHRDLASWTQRGADGYIGIWTISDRRTGEKYGTAAVLPMPIEAKDTDFSLVTPGKIPPGHLEIGYYLKRTAWGRGYATEAGRRLLEFIFRETEVEELVATLDSENTASRRVLEKIGFLNSGTMRCYGKESPVYRITRSEWARLDRSA
jgi:ribosomal-protein-alanine N-acetyltransferase